MPGRDVDVAARATMQAPSKAAQEGREVNSHPGRLGAGGEGELTGGVAARRRRRVPASGVDAVAGEFGRLAEQVSGARVRPRVTIGGCSQIQEAAVWSVRPERSKTIRS